MTAEIAILNKSAVALAADSAVTVGGGLRSKVFNTVNKLFCLSRVHPVGAMIYGVAEMGGVPWETIIKLYRATLGPAAFDSLDEYAKHFLAFLNGNKALFPENAQVQCVSSALRAAFRALIEGVKTRYVIATQDKGCAPDPSEVAQMVVEACRSARDELDSAPFRDGQSEADAVAIRHRYAAVIANVRDESFMTLPMTKEAEGHIHAISGLIFSKANSLGDSSGIVVAGFGEAEHFPSVIGVEIWGIQNDQLRFSERDRGSVTLEIPSRLMAFAQKEMVVTFMEGVDPEYSGFFSSALEKLLIKHYPEEIVGLLGASGVQADMLRKQLSQLGEGARDELLKELAAYRRKQHIGPIVDAVEHLPKEDLAALAESLVNLTSLKRRFTLDAETVGGPIDVAVISKGDGFVWMKRKHYFQPELNPQFFMRYLAGGKSDDQFEQEGRGPGRERA